MDDLVKRLRDKEMSFSECWQVMPEAADRIEKLEAALREIFTITEEMNEHAPVAEIQMVTRRALEGSNG